MAFSVRKLCEVPGVARKIAIVVLLISAVAWIVFVAGFVLRNYKYKTRSGNQPSDEVEAILFRMEIVLTGVLSELLPDGARVSGVDVASSVTDLLSDATDDLRTDLREILDHPTADALTNIADTFLSVLENVLNGSIPDEISHLSVNEVLSQVQAVLLEDLNNVISLSDPNTVVPNLPGSLNQPTSDALTNIVDTFLCILRNALPSLDRSEVQPLLFEVLNTVISLSDPDIVVPNFPRLRDQPTSDALTNVVDAFLCTLRNALPSLDRSEVQPLLFEVLSTVSSLSKSNSSTANTNTTDAVNITVVLNFPRSLDHVSRPAFFFHWLLLVIGPLIMVATTVHILCWKSTATTMFVVFLILPLFLVGGGGVFFFDGLQIYERIEDRLDELLGITLPDAAVLLLRQYQQFYGIDILNEDWFVLVEFGGALVTVLSYWICLLLMPCFRKGYLKTKRDLHELKDLNLKV